MSHKDIETICSAVLFSVLLICGAVVAIKVRK